MVFFFYLVAYMPWVFSNSFKNKQSLDHRLTIFQENWDNEKELVIFQFTKYYKKLLKTGKLKNELIHRHFSRALLKFS